MKIFSWALIVLGVLVVVGAVGDPTEEKSLDQMIFWMLAGSVMAITGWFTRRSWEKRGYEFPAWCIVLGALGGWVAARDWYSGEWQDHAATTNHLFTLAVVVVLYGIGLLAAMAIRDRLKLERS